jgi:hypothetical protein
VFFVENNRNWIIIPQKQKSPVMDEAFELFIHAAHIAADLKLTQQQH